MEKTRIPFEYFKAVIFDMDGTMVNNKAYHQQAWSEFLKAHGLQITTDEFQQKFSGRKNDHIITQIFSNPFTTEEILHYSEAKEDIYRQIYKSDIKEVPGLHRIITFIQKKGLKLAIATTANKKNREFVLDALGLHGKFDVIFGEEHVVHGKPNPEIYLSAAKKLHLDPSDCLVFEDSPPGVEAGKKAGMTVVGVMTAHSPQELQSADYFIKDYSDIIF